MFFVLSKTLNFLVQPLVIITAFLLLGLFVRNKKYRQRFLFIGIGLLLFLSNDFISKEMARAWEPPVTPISDMPVYDYGIVLTGITKTSMEPHDRVYFARGADRATQAVHLYKVGKIKKIVVSGGSGKVFNEDIREADELSGFFFMAGVDPDDLIIENNSHNTRESAVEVKKLLEKNPGSCLLITSGYHLRRAEACFKKAGLKVSIFTAEPFALPREFTFSSLVIPSLEALGIWHALIREWVGMITYKLVGYI